ncbi:MAG TPA: Mrp/NBP35 family ATP-binding protein [Bacilli bacterium]|nr:Mrp/NBP35 family ATP-binding protein [Bacilli bacterium]
MSENKKACADTECTKESCEDCSSNPQSLLEKANQYSKIKKVIGVVSGKGGVGKSLITSLLAVTMNRANYKTAILDADITGPSIPKMFGLTDKAMSSEMGILPVKTKTEIEVMSINLLLENDTDPVVWRGPLIAGAVKQFWTDVAWGDIDFMFVDMPPGTGDVALTVFQSLPIDGIIIVTSPQELVSMIVTKAVKMAEVMNINILGVVENMSYVSCPDCKKEIKVFGESHLEEIAEKHNIETIARIPIDRFLALQCDKGTIELFNGDWLEPIAAKLEKLIDKN